MADEHDTQRERSFHWPPTAEELESIQVVDMGDDAQRRELIRAKPSAWQRLVDSMVMQAGLVAASLAAIGIAITSLLAPAHSAGRAQKSETRAVGASAPASAPEFAPASPQPTAEQPKFRPMVTLDLERPSAHPQAQPAPRLQPQRPQAVAAASRSSAGEPPVAGNAIGTRSGSPHARARRGDAGRDRVSKFAVRTGLSVWKTMRAIGRSFKRDHDEN